MVQSLNTGSIKPGSERVRLRNEARRTEILRAAARVFRRLGLADAGMREIAQEAGLSPGNLYHYFSGKDQILLFCQERTLERLLAAADRARHSDASASERLRQVLRAHVHAMLDDLEGATAHLEVEALPQALRAPVIERRDAYERALRAMVAQGVARGEFGPCDPALVTRAMLGAVNWSARWYRPEGAKSSASIADAMADYLVNGLRGAENARAQPAASIAGAAGGAGGAGRKGARAVAARAGNKTPAGRRAAASGAER
jgi:AcrR family transcriptional regulator